MRRWKVGNMNQFVHNKVPKNHIANCDDRMRMAQRELAAFLSAVREHFGSEQAKLSAEDWLQELTAMENLPFSPREWRGITVNVLARLANRVNASSISAASELAYLG